MTRLEAAIKELRAAMGERAWVLVFDPCHPDSENWGLFTENSHDAPYVRIGLLKMGLDRAIARLAETGEAATPLSHREARRSPAIHRFEGPGQACSRCGMTQTDFAVSGEECSPQ